MEQHFNISTVIQQVCKDNKISYQSKHFDKIQDILKDIKTFKKLEKSIEKMITKLHTIKKKHYNIQYFIDLIDSIVHKLIDVECEIKKEEANLRLHKINLKKLVNKVDTTKDNVV